MRRAKVYALGFILLLPYLVSVDGDSSNDETNFLDLAIGTGLYAKVDRDCSGKVVNVDKRNFWDIGAKYIHKKSFYKLTAAAGITSGDKDNVSSSGTGPVPPYTPSPAAATPLSTPFISGTAGVDTKYVGFDFGGLAMMQKRGAKLWPACGLRIGNEGSFFFSVGTGLNTSLLAGNALTDFGIGFNLGAPHSLLWLGLGGYPYDESNGVFSLKMDLPMYDKIILEPRIGLGLGGFGEYSFALGTRIQF